MVQNGSKWSEMVQNGPKWSKMAKQMVKMAPTVMRGIVFQVAMQPFIYQDIAVCYSAIRMDENCKSVGFFNTKLQSCLMCILITKGTYLFTTKQQLCDF